MLYELNFLHEACLSLALVQSKLLTVVRENYLLQKRLHAYQNRLDYMLGLSYLLLYVQNTEMSTFVVAP